MTEQTKSVVFQKSNLAQGGTEHKEYRLHLEPCNHPVRWQVRFQNGRIGSNLTNKIKIADVEYAVALDIFNETLQTRLDHGYHLVTPVIPKSSPTDEQIRQNILEALKSRSKEVKTDAASTIRYRECELLENLDVNLDHTNADGSTNLDLTNQSNAAQYVKSDAYFMQDKRDGERRRVVKENGLIFGLNRKAQAVELDTKIKSELETLPYDTFDIDAEIEGNFLICFDALDLNGDIGDEPYSKRLGLLTRALSFIADRQFVMICPTWITRVEKEGAYTQQVAKRAEGVVFKLAAAPYRPGRNGAHKKFKFVKMLSAEVLRHTLDKESISLGLYDEVGACHCIGDVSVHGKGELRIGDVVEIIYLYATKDRRVYQPRIHMIRRDIDRATCTMSQLIFKQGVK